MKQKTFITILLTVLMSLVGLKAFAQDIEVKNADGVILYYRYINDGKELLLVRKAKPSIIKYSGNIVIPEDVTFMNRTRKVTSINGLAFRDCTGLTSVTIPNSVTSIGKQAFEGCTGLTSITIPSNTTSIDAYAFEGCTGLTSITIPYGVEYIWDGTFSGCTGLTSVNIPNSVRSIRTEAFSSCTGLTSVNIPNGVRWIYEKAFYKCTRLTSVTIPQSVESIGKQAFDGMDFPSVISLIENPDQIEGKSSDGRTFSTNTFNNATLYVPKGTIEKYKATEGWKDFLFIEEGNGPEGGGETPEIKKCATPTISYQKGELSFACATPDVEFHWSVTNATGENSSGSGISSAVSPWFKVSVYATKKGFDNSDTTTRQFEYNNGGLKGDVDGNGVVNVADHVELSKIIMSQE